MSKNKILLQILQGKSDRNIPFDDLCRLLYRLGFEERVKGSHHIFTKYGINEIVNLQPIGTLSKPYQIRQVRNIILKNKLGDDSND